MLCYRYAYEYFFLLERYWDQMLPVVRLGESRDVLASWYHITIQLQDRLPAPLRDMHDPKKDYLLFRNPSGDDPPVWILPLKWLGLLYKLEHRGGQNQERPQKQDAGRRGSLASKNLVTAFAMRLANLSRVIVL
jgi:hypothetical protein